MNALALLSLVATWTQMGSSVKKPIVVVAYGNAAGTVQTEARELSHHDVGMVGNREMPHAYRCYRSPCRSPVQ